MAYGSEEHGESNWDRAWYRVQARGDCFIVTAAGEIDMHSAAGLDRAAQVALGHFRSLIIDLSRTAYIDSSGLGALISVRSRAHEHGGSVALVAPPDFVRRLLTQSRLQDSFPVFETVQQALNAAGRGG